ncbi:unannotated protein [freshwater metagenome]|uniref:Unannotated protein n=1 Tax=freshwater metagenome TaxID=449393 RepID=A0A6J7UE44_9ZZZZ
MQSSPATARFAGFGAAVAEGATATIDASAIDATSAPANFFLNIETLL